MAAISVTYTFANSTTADATQVNTNFNDIVNGTSDGTKDFDIGSLIVEGATTLKGNVSLGDGTPDDITFNGSIASSIPVKTNATYNFGTSTLGLNSIYIGSSGSLTTRLLSGATGSSWSLTFPSAVPSASGMYLAGATDGTTSWAAIRRSPDDKQNYAISTSVNANAMTVNLLAADGTTPSSTNSVDIVFRNLTAATGTPTTVSVTSALSVTIPSGATLGLKDAVNQYIYLYAMNNSGTVELCVAGSNEFDTASLQSSTAVSNAADSSNVLYGTSGRASKPIRLLGRILSNQSTAGTYASNSTEISLHPQIEKTERSEIWLTGGAGHGSTNTTVRRFTTLTTNVGTALTATQSAANGDSITVNEIGNYTIDYSDSKTGGATSIGITINSTQLTTNIASISIPVNRGRAVSTGGGTPIGMSRTLKLNVGDVIRAQTDTGPDETAAIDVSLHVMKVSS